MDVRKNFLGVDWGSSKVGIALAHAETGVALAYDTIDNTEELLAKLGEIIAREEVGTVVIGIPSHISRKETEYEGEKLGRSLEGTYHVTTAYQDEMFTTKMAQANLIERGEKHVGRHDDAEAARIILQSYMDRGQRTENKEQ